MSRAGGQHYNAMHADDMLAIDSPSLTLKLGLLISIHERTVNRRQRPTSRPCNEMRSTAVTRNDKKANRACR